MTQWGIAIGFWATLKPAGAKVFLLELPEQSHPQAFMVATVDTLTARVTVVA